MDQEVIYDVGKFDRSQVNLNKTATNVKEFMQQMIVSREQCEKIVSVRLEDIPVIKAPTVCLVPADTSKNVVCKWIPDKEWRKLKSDNFSVLRSNLEELHIENNFRELVLPSAGEAKKWCQICLEEKLTNVPLDPALAPKFAHHNGTPPTLSFVKSLSDHRISCLIIHLIEYFLENGYSRPLFEWIFALLAVVKKPLLHDVCSALREMARKCRILRAHLTENEMDLIYEYTAMIAIVGIYFLQKDLAD